MPVLKLEKLLCEHTRITLNKLKARLEILEDDLRDYYSKLEVDGIKLDPYISDVYVTDCDISVDIALRILIQPYDPPIVEAQFCFDLALKDASVETIADRLNKNFVNRANAYCYATEVYPHGLGGTE